MPKRDLRFAVHPSFAVTRLEHDFPLHAQGLGKRLVESTYYDTEDLRLARSGVEVLLVVDGPKSTWILTLPVHDGKTLRRKRFLRPVTSTEVPRDLVELTMAYGRAAELGPIATIRTKRSRWELRDEKGKNLVEVADDELSLLRSGRVTSRSRELRLQPTKAKAKQVASIKSVLEAAGAARSEPIPKVVRALGPHASSAPDLVPPDPGPDRPSAMALRAALVSDAARLIEHDASARLGVDEAVHQMRVGARRLRNDFKLFAPLLDPLWVKGFTGELKWLGSLLGEVRDLDVIRACLEHTSADLRDDLATLFEALHEASLEARSHMLDAMISDRYRRLLEDLTQAATEPRTNELASADAGQVLPRLAEPVLLKLQRAVRRLGSDHSPERLHRVRLRCKRARYAAEAIAPGLPPKLAATADLFARRAGKVQDVLGVQHDAVMASDWIRSHVSGQSDHRLSFAAGRLVERQQRDIARARRDWKAAWEKLDRRKSKIWLKS